MTDELDVIDGSTMVEDTFFIDGKSKHLDDYLDGVNEVLTLIEQTGDFEIGANTLRSMSNVGHAIGISKAKLLHGMKELWEQSGRGYDDFCQYVIDFGHLSSAVIVGRYIDAWDAVIHSPATVMDRLILQPMKNLNALGAAIAQGFQPDEEDWEQLADVHDNNQFLKIIREDVKGKPARKNSLTIYLEENGDLVAWKEDKRYPLGYLNVQDADDVDAIDKAIQRIIKGSGIQRH